MDMARRKRVRQTSERDVGMFDMIDSSAFSGRMFHPRAVFVAAEVVVGKKKYRGSCFGRRKREGNSTRVRKDFKMRTRKLYKSKSLENVN